MSSTSNTLYEVNMSEIPCFAMEDTDTGEITKWWAWPSTKIDNTKLSKEMTELPVYRDVSADGSPAYFDRNHALNHLAFRLDPDDNSKMLVIVMRDCDKRRNEMRLIYQYTRPFQVNVGTPMKVVSMLLNHLSRRESPAEERIHLDYGDVNTLRSWEEAYDVSGYVGVSTGRRRAFLLIHKKNSPGGSTIMTDCILSIRTAKKERQKGGPNDYHYFYTLNKLFTNPLRKIKY